jgi:hypothetical protein
VLQHLAAIGALRASRQSQSSEERHRAARLLGYVDARLAALESPREYTEQHEYDAALAALRAELDREEFSKLLEEGGAWSEDRAVAEALLV